MDADLHPLAASSSTPPAPNPTPTQPAGGGGSKRVRDAVRDDDLSSLVDLLGGITTDVYLQACSGSERGRC